MRTARCRICCMSMRSPGGPCKSFCVMRGKRRLMCRHFGRGWWIAWMPRMMALRFGWLNAISSLKSICIKRNTLGIMWLPKVLRAMRRCKISPSRWRSAFAAISRRCSSIVKSSFIKSTGGAYKPWMRSTTRAWPWGLAQITPMPLLYKPPRRHRARTTRVWLRGFCVSDRRRLARLRPMSEAIMSGAMWIHLPVSLPGF